jgi:cytochrome c-type biogenesis protein CcmF
MGLVANPDTKHYVGHDVFTYVSSVPNKEKSEVKYINEKKHDVKAGDTIYTNNALVVLEKINTNVKEGSEAAQNLEVMLGARLRIITLDKEFVAIPVYGVKDGAAIQNEAVVDEAGLKFAFTGVNPDKGTITITTAEKDSTGDFIIMKAIVFPWINLVWAGTIVMVIGFLLSIWKRLDQLRDKAKA